MSDAFSIILKNYKMMMMAENKTKFNHDDILEVDY